VRQAWIAVVAGLAAMGAAPADEVPWPEGYRAWTHVKSAYVGPGGMGWPRYGGVHHIYANDQAMAGYRSGRFPEGAVIAFDLMDAKASEAGVEATQRKFVDVMRKGPDGWVFGEYAPGGRERLVTAAQGAQRCAGCHAGPGAQDGVFSRYRD